VDIILLEEAQRQFELRDRWWRKHREAKDLFVDEFERALAAIRSMPDAGQKYRFVRGRLIRRWLMPKTGCHVYYLYDRQRDITEIHSLWGARRRRGPSVRQSESR
jgi:hypothetical protein